MDNLTAAEIMARNEAVDEKLREIHEKYAAPLLAQVEREARALACYQHGHKAGFTLATADLFILLEKHGVDVKAGSEMECLELHLTRSRQHITEFNNEKL